MRTDVGTHSQSSDPGGRSAEPVLASDVFTTFLELLQPKELAGMYRHFVEHTRERLLVLSKPCEPELLGRELHSLRGTAAMLGAAELSALASELEQLPGEQVRLNLEPLRQATDQLNSALLAAGVAL